MMKKLPFYDSNLGKDEILHVNAFCFENTLFILTHSCGTGAEIIK